MGLQNTTHNWGRTTWESSHFRNSDGAQCIRSSPGVEAITCNLVIQTLNDEWRRNGGVYPLVICYIAIENGDL